jgi:putative oxidoreductase
MNYARFATRIITGLMFLVIGLSKLADPQGTAGFLDQLGFPVSTVLAWALIIVEVVGGSMILAGYKMKMAAVPLFVVLFVATLLVQLGIPASFTAVLSQFTSSSVWLHLLGMAVLYDFAANGAGELSLSG